MPPITPRTEHLIAELIRRSGNDQREFETLLNAAATGRKGAVDSLAEAVEIDVATAAELALASLEGSDLPIGQLAVRRDRLRGLIEKDRRDLENIDPRARGHRLGGRSVVDPEATTVFSTQLDATGGLAPPAKDNEPTRHTGMTDAEREECYHRKADVARRLALVDEPGEGPARLTERGELLLRYLNDVAEVETVSRTKEELARLKSLPTESKIHRCDGRCPVEKAVRSLQESPVSDLRDRQVPMESTRDPISLYLKSITLNESFDFNLLGSSRAMNELYVVAIAWDLSGNPPQVFPPDLLADNAKLTYQLKKGEKINFIGNGLQLKAKGKVEGGLYLRLIVMESDSEARQLGEQMAKVRETVQKSDLTKTLAALTAGATAGTVAAVGAAATALSAGVAEVLKQNEDDLVAVFDGTYGPEFLQATRNETYDQRGASIELGVVAGEGAAA